jgi:hypothetical protein
MMAMALPLSLSLGGGVGAGPASLRWPSAGSLVSSVARLVDVVTDQHPAAPKIPVQRTGSAPSRSRQVPAAVTRAVEHAAGLRPGKGRGQLPAFSLHAPAQRTFVTGAGSRGTTTSFNPRSSKVVASGTTATSDLYKNADGSYTKRVYGAAVNYRTSSGAWAAIDPDLASAAGGRWEEKANSDSVSFAGRAAAKQLGSLAAAGGAQSVSFSLAGAANVPGTTDGATITYPGVRPGTDLTETATADGGITETLVLHSADVATTWDFPLQTDGLTPILSQGSVDLENAAGKTVWVIPPAVASSGPAGLTDGTPQATSVLTYQLVPSAGGTELEMTLDPSWLDAPGRVFPVVVDPSLDPDYTEYSTYVEEDGSTPYTSDNGTSDFMPVGYYDPYTAIGLLDFSGEIGDVIPNYHVTAASMDLFDVWADQCSSSEDVDLYQATSAWGSGGYTGSTTYPGPTTGSEVASWDGTASSAACDNTGGETGMGSWLSLGFNSTGLSLLNDWTLGGSTPDYGFAVKAETSSDAGWKQFDSYQDDDVSTSAGGDCKGNCTPYLDITYLADTPPQINKQYPPNNYNSTTLTPELLAEGADPDNWPDALQYDFTVYNASGTQVATSGKISSGDWTVPASADLSWGQTYYWVAQDYDGLDWNVDPEISYFSTPVPQPLVTSGLSQNASGPGFDPANGNYTTSATDAKVSTVGPALEITRDYNSDDPRTKGAFGAGWSSILDMKVTPGQTDSSGNTATEVVTYPDGNEVGFGLNPTTGAYSPPPGQYAQLRSVSGGFTLTDKNDTVYTFTQSLTGGGYGITKIADALGNTETFTNSSSDEVTEITSASKRTLSVGWNTATPAHVSSVTTGDVTAGNNSSALTWTYAYSGNELTSVCPPSGSTGTSSTACTVYTYGSGSDYPESALDSGPHSYWRLDESSGTVAASSVLANEGADDASYSSGVSLANAGGGLAGSSAKVPDFNGTSGDVHLPPSLVNQAAYMSVSLWFWTTTDNGVLFSYENDPLSDGTTTADYTPALYIGSDGKLNAEFWNGKVEPITTSASVANGQWHMVTLTASGNTQTLYLDGQKVSALSGAISVTGQSNDYLGAGFIGASWPDESHEGEDGPTAYATYYRGFMSDAAIWGRALTPTEVSAMYTAGTGKAALLSKVTRPSGNVYAQVGYGGVDGTTVTGVTDSNGGSWTMHAPTVTGSSQVYVASVLGAQPDDYYRLADTGTTDAVDQVAGGTASYTNVTQGASGPFSDATADTFTGSDDSYITLPSDDRVTTGPGTVELWFKTSVLHRPGRPDLRGGRRVHPVAVRRLGREPVRRVLEQRHRGNHRDHDPRQRREVALRGPVGRDQHPDAVPGRQASRQRLRYPLLDRFARRVPRRRRPGRRLAGHRDCAGVLLHRVDGRVRLLPVPAVRRPGRRPVRGVAGVRRAFAGRDRHRDRPRWPHAHLQV